MKNLYTSYVIFRMNLLNRKIIRQQKRVANQYKKDCVLSIYFGVPGSGKSTFASYLVKKDLKHGQKVWSNVPITGALKLDASKDIGKYMICDGRVIIDEAGIEYDSRAFKSFSKEATYFYKYHRHYQCPIDMFSQGWDDVDKKIRTLAARIYIVKKLIFPCFILRREIGKKIDIDKQTGQIIDRYYWKFLGFKIIFSPLLWNMFNTHSRKEFPNKKWDVY